MASININGLEEKLNLLNELEEKGISLDGIINQQETIKSLEEQVKKLEERIRIGYYNIEHYTKMLVYDISAQITEDLRSVTLASFLEKHSEFKKYSKFQNFQNALEYFAYVNTIKDLKEDSKFVDSIDGYVKRNDMIARWIDKQTHFHSTFYPEREPLEIDFTKLVIEELCEGRGLWGKMFNDIYNSQALQKHLMVNVGNKDQANEYVLEYICDDICNEIENELNNQYEPEDEYGEGWALDFCTLLSYFNEYDYDFDLRQFDGKDYYTEIYKPIFDKCFDKLDAIDKAIIAKSDYEAEDILETVEGRFNDRLRFLFGEVHNHPDLIGFEPIFEYDDEEEEEEEEEE